MTATTRPRALQPGMGLACMLLVAAASGAVDPARKTAPQAMQAAGTVRMALNTADHSCRTARTDAPDPLTAELLRAHGSATSVLALIEAAPHSGLRPTIQASSPAACRDTGAHP